MKYAEGVKDGHNWYAYCGNNPLIFTDQLGLAPEILENGIARTVFNKNSPIIANVAFGLIQNDAFLITAYGQNVQIKF